MSKISDLKREYNERVDNIIPFIFKDEYENTLKIIDNNPNLRDYIKNERIRGFVQGMNFTAEILFGETVNQL